mmetsp:Transcript_77489/g.207003  ORF Transcript_77489/g.207003 Transcript_77489/m.207003 type:complete len:436 (-) Transcript_77489:89-1396(-)
MACSVLGLLCCGGLCCPSCAAQGQETGLRMPRSCEELERLGQPWMRELLRRSGYPHPLQSMTVVPTSAGGLSSSSTMLSLVFESGGGTESREVFVKLVPAKRSSRVLTQLLRMHVLEYMFYTRIAAKVQDDILLPRLLVGDCSPTSGLYILAIEKLSSRMPRMYEPGNPAPLSLADVRACLTCLATWHARFWGDVHATRDDLGFALPDKGFARKLVAREAKRRWPKFVKLMDQHLPGRLTPAMRGLFQLAVRQDIVRLNRRWGWTVLCHGDAHCENFFLDETVGEVRAGLLDFQSLAVRDLAVDLSWFWVSSIPVVVAKDHDQVLLQHYHDVLSSKLAEYGEGSPPGQVSELKEQVAVYVPAVLLRLVLVVGTGLVDLGTEKEKSTWQFDRLDAALQFFEVPEVFERYVAGQTLAQKRVATANPKPGSGRRVAPV